MYRVYFECVHTVISAQEDCVCLCVCVREKEKATLRLKSVYVSVSAVVCRCTPIPDYPKFIFQLPADYLA